MEVLIKKVKIMKNKKRTWSKTLKRFFSLILLRKLRYTKYFFLTFLWWINWVIHVLFLEKVVFNLEKLNSEGFYNILIYYGIYIFIFEICNYLMRNWGWTKVESKQTYDIYNEYLNKYIRLDNNIVETIWTWKLIWIIHNWSRSWSELLSESVERLMMIFVSFMFTIYMISRVNINYTFIFILLCVIFFFLGKYANTRLHEYRKQRYELWNTLLRNFTKIIMSKVDILQSWKIDIDMKKMYLNLEHEENINVNMSIWRNFIKRISPFGITLMMFFAFWYLWTWVINWSIELSVLVWLTWTLIIIQKSIIDAMSFYVVFTKKIIHVEKIFDFFDTTPEIKWYETWNDFKYKKWDIKIENLDYYYTKWKPIFENFNLKIEWEKILALVWNSGSWKSTLAKLISWYIHQVGWNIIIDWQKLIKTSLKSYYKQIWYLTQEPSVFDWTVLDNLTYSIDRDLIEWELEEIIKFSKCEFIYDLQKWLDTEIWERWVKLSGWQKQRLAIAKIFLKNPKIIILDEPTSALDSFSEEQITKAMHNLFKNRTVIVIAHRLQTVKHADKIIVLENWKVVETWNHKELVKQKWIYKKMLDLQSWF